MVVPLAPSADWRECLAFARGVAEVFARREPGCYTTWFRMQGREALLLIDYLRNNRTNTSVAAYSTRAKPTATVSVPLTWQELSSARRPERFTAASIRARLSRLRRDPWSGCWTVKQRLPRAAVQALERM